MQDLSTKLELSIPHLPNYHLGEFRKIEKSDQN